MPWPELQDEEAVMLQASFVMIFPLLHWDTLSITKSFVVLQDSALEAEKLFAEVFPDSSKLDASQLEKRYSVSRCTSFALRVITILYNTVKIREGWFIQWNEIQQPKRIEFDDIRWPPNFQFHQFRQGLCHGLGRHPGSFNLRSWLVSAKTDRRQLSD